MEADGLVKKFSVPSSQFSVKPVEPGDKVLF
jgi:hypothetical protein